jgi:hypothetical protein
MHPLVSNLTELSLDELQKKYGELMKRRVAAFRFGNPDMIHQLDMILSDYQNEINNRNAKELAELEKRTKSSEFKGIIDIQ